MSEIQTKIIDVEKLVKTQLDEISAMLNKHNATLLLAAFPAKEISKARNNKATNFVVIKSHAKDYTIGELIALIERFGEMTLTVDKSENFSFPYLVSLH